MNTKLAVLLTLSLIFSFGSGAVNFETLAVSADASYNFTDVIAVDAKLGYHYAFDKDAAQSGIYIDVLGNYKNYVKAGLGTNLHLVDGKVKADFGVVGGLHVPFSSTNAKLKLFSADLGVRYDFVNMTKAPAFSFEIGASADVYNIITNLLDQH